MKKGKDFQWSHFWSNSSIFRNVNPTFTTVKVLINNRKLFQHTVLRSSFSFHSFHTSFYNNCVWLLNKVKCLKGHTCTSTHFYHSLNRKQFTARTLTFSLLLRLFFSLRVKGRPLRSFLTSSSSYRENVIKKY